MAPAPIADLSRLYELNSVVFLYKCIVARPRIVAPVAASRAATVCKGPIRSDNKPVPPALFADHEENCMAISSYLS